MNTLMNSISYILDSLRRAFSVKLESLNFILLRWRGHWSLLNTEWCIHICVLESPLWQQWDKCIIEETVWWQVGYCYNPDDKLEWTKSLRKWQQAALVEPTIFSNWLLVEIKYRMRSINWISLRKKIKKN